jgi:predicted nucleic acid-binding Zn ribbon protein
LPRLQDGAETNPEFCSLIKHTSIASGVVVHGYGWYLRNIVVNVRDKSTKAKKEN